MGAAKLTKSRRSALAQQSASSGSGTTPEIKAGQENFGHVLQQMQNFGDDLRFFACCKSF
jgi:hypothetical protein